MNIQGLAIEDSAWSQFGNEVSTEYTTRLL